VHKVENNSILGYFFEGSSPVSGPTNPHFKEYLMNRRDFLKLCGLAATGLTFGIGTTGCSPYPKNVNWKDVPDNEFSIQKFDDWFETHKLYNGLNPNLKLGDAGFSPTFRGSILSGWSPGMDYASNNMYAVADGIVRKIGDIKIRYGGTIVEVVHVGTHQQWYDAEIFVSYYAHLSTVKLGQGESVKRGDLIGPTMGRDHAKLMFSFNYNFIDPDNYGEQHNYMDYWDGKKEYGHGDIAEKRQNQVKIIQEFSSFIELNPILSYYSLTRRKHREFRENKACTWDVVEQFEYLAELYQGRPSYFAGVSQEKFAEYKKDFYANQPIILTLPLKA
jgi:hypothetical protein